MDKKIEMIMLALKNWDMFDMDKRESISDDDTMTLWNLREELSSGKLIIQLKEA